MLRFRARKGEHRREAMERYLSGEGNLDHATGVIEMFSDGVPFGRVPFVQGLFGRWVQWVPGLPGVPGMAVGGG